MKIRWRYGIAFPLVLAVALGGLSAWLEQISEIETEEVRLNPDEPQYSMDGIDGRRFDEQGRLKENLSAERAVQYPDSHDIHFDKVHLSFYREGSLLYEVSGAAAVYGLKNKQVNLERGVVLTKAAQADKPQARIETENLHVDTEAQTADTQAPVSFRYGESSGSSVGMTYDQKTGLLNLPSKVKAIIYDTKHL